MVGRDSTIAFDQHVGNASRDGRRDLCFGRRLAHRWFLQVRARRFEKFHDLHDEGHVTIKGTCGLAFLAFGKAMEFFVLPVNTFGSVFPGAGDFDFAVGRRAALDRFAAGTEDSEHSFDAVDTIPKQIGVVLLYFAWAVSFDVIDFADGAVVYRQGIFGEAQGRRTEDGNFSFFGEAKDFDDVGQSHMGLSMKTGLPALSTGLTCSR